MTSRQAENCLQDVSEATHVWRLKSRQPALPPEANSIICEFVHAVYSIKGIELAARVRLRSSLHRWLPERTITKRIQQ